MPPGQHAGRCHLSSSETVVPYRPASREMSLMFGHPTFQVFQNSLKSRAPEGLNAAACCSPQRMAFRVPFSRVGITAELPPEISLDLPLFPLPLRKERAQAFYERVEPPTGKVFFLGDIVACPLLLI